MTSTETRTTTTAAPGAAGEATVVSHNTRRLKGAAHPWYPHSGCGKTCADAGRRGTSDPAPVIAGRVAGLVRVPLLLVLATVVMNLPSGMRTAAAPVLARRALAMVGVDVVVDTEPEALQALRSGALVAVNHHTWWDVPVLAAVAPMRFIARGDIGAVPVLGGLMARLGTVYIDRSSLRDLPQVVATAADGLTRGHTLVAFPEATTWCGHAHGRMRPALFQSAVDADAPVVPVAIEYRTAAGERTTAAAFVGRDTVAGSLWHVVSGKVASVHVRLGAPLRPGRDVPACRRELAEATQRAVFGRSGEHAHRD